MPDSETAAVLVGHDWRASIGTTSFDKFNPASGALVGRFPISPWSEVDEALEAGSTAFHAMRELGPEANADMLEVFADRIEATRAELVATACEETALPVQPRLSDELSRTTDQLRQAAAAAASHSWTMPTLSPATRIASRLAPIPGVAPVFGPNNFPFAFNSAAGGDFASAIATGHPVIAKGNPGHPETTRILAGLARLAAVDAGLPPTTVQLIYRISHADGATLVSDHRVAATAYTGSRNAGLALKAAADAHGRPIYLEMSSVNPVVILPEAAERRGSVIAEELAGSMMNGMGQFCTSPGLIFVPASDAGDHLASEFMRLATGIAPSALLDNQVVSALVEQVACWVGEGASVVATAEQELAASCAFPTTILTIDSERFIGSPAIFQSEAFGNASLLVRFSGIGDLAMCIDVLEGNLTGTIYSASDDATAYRRVESTLREKVGRLLNDKAPTGVSVVAAMNHGGPYPSTGHPGFSAVGIPASLFRFGMLQCYDNVPDERLPPELRADNPLALQRFVNGDWTRQPIVWGA